MIEADFIEKIINTYNGNHREKTQNISIENGFSTILKGQKSDLELNKDAKFLVEKLIKKILSENR